MFSQTLQQSKGMLSNFKFPDEVQGLNQSGTQNAPQFQNIYLFT